MATRKYDQLFFLGSDFSTIFDDDVSRGLTRLGSLLFDGTEEIHTFSDLTEDGVSAIQPGGLNKSNKELRTVGVGSSVGHREQSGDIMGNIEVLIVELSTIDRFTSGSISAGEVTTLSHESGNNTMEFGSLVVQGLAGTGLASITNAQSSEVLRSFGGLRIE
eukprot:CAMPEP_0115005988 /NCGR_PEP_ID=MMETSP0216-20121206/20215_1 /TAXON_ID=223996 /ORGANISM="Protocruzia adherens, Strain Boccale" /LENGTH=161 /DNA_ID=CAMNT_0002372451 /DNA_START=1296 /DNA_END=1781 /DNA_ORIENTATION=-